MFSSKEVSKAESNCTMDKIYDLHTQLMANIMEIDNITDKILKLEESNNIDALEVLYKNEFLLYMNNVSIYEDLMKYLVNEPKTIDNELELMRLKKQAQEMLLVDIVEL